MKCISFRLTIRKPKATIASPLKPVEVSTTPPEFEQPRFVPTFRACRMGYAQGYELPDGQTMSEGTAVCSSSWKAKEELKRMVAKASTIIERVPRYRNRSGDVGERMVAQFPPDENGKEWVSIIWYGGGKHYSYIDAPSLELALEFERSNVYAY